MPTNVIMPALEMAQETGKVVRWLKAPGEQVTKGEPLIEVETDKVTVELEAPASGLLHDVSARPGDVVPVGATIAVIVAPGEAAVRPAPGAATGSGAAPPSRTGPAAPLAATVPGKDGGSRLPAAAPAPSGAAPRLVPASPKARRLAAERGVNVAALRGSGPLGAVLAADVPAATRPVTEPAGAATAAPVGTVWRIMAERMTASWTTAPHFYLVREVNVSRLVRWREQASRQTGARITYTDLLIKLAAAALVRHPRANVSWKDGTIVQHAEVNVGLAVAVEEGLVVPVIHRADTLGVAGIAARREDVVARAQAGRLRPADIQGGSFTVSNLGMHGVDAFSAIVNPPQAGILAVGRIADRVVPVNGQPAVQPMMVLTLSCDHRALDGARGAQLLGSLADLIEEPLALLG